MKCFQDDIAATQSLIRLENRCKLTSYSSPIFLPSALLHVNRQHRDMTTYWSIYRYVIVQLCDMQVFYSCICDHLRIIHNFRMLTKLPWENKERSEIWEWRIGTNHVCCWIKSQQHTSRKTVMLIVYFVCLVWRLTIIWGRDITWYEWKDPEYWIMRS